MLLFSAFGFFLVEEKFQFILKLNDDTEGLIYKATIKLKQIRSFNSIEGFQNSILYSSELNLS